MLSHVAHHIVYEVVVVVVVHSQTTTGSVPPRRRLGHLDVLSLACRVGSGLGFGQECWSKISNLRGIWYSCSHTARGGVPFLLVTVQHDLLLGGQVHDGHFNGHNCQ